jgi:replicative DNA helicase
VKKPDESALGKRPWEVFDKEIFPYLTVERLFGDLQSLRRDGRFWQAYCPVHQDKQGAFSIDPQTLEWNCFLGCGGGGPVQYLQSVRGLSWMDAAMELARLGGVDPGILEPWSRLWTKEDFALHDQLERRSSLLGIFMAYARSIYHSPASQTLRSELVRRYGFSERTVETLDLGLYSAPEDIWHYLKKSGRELEEVREWGLFETQWTGCILGSWKDLSGRIINIWGWQPREPLAEAARFEGYVLFPEDDALGGRGIPLNLDAAARQEETKLVLVEDPLAALLTRSLGLERPFPIASGGNFNCSQMEAIQEYLSLGGELTLCWNHDPYARGTKLDRISRSLELLQAATFPVYVMDSESMVDLQNPKKRVTVTDFILSNGGGKKGLKAFRSLLEEREVEVSVQEDTSAKIPHDWPGVSEVFRGAAPGGFATPGGQKSTDAASGYPQILQMLLRAADEIGRRVAKGFLSGLPSELVQGLSHGAQGGLELPTTRGVGELQASNSEIFTPAFSVDRLEEETRMTPVGKRSGWAALDLVGIRFNPGELAVLSGKMAHGKTSMLLGILLEWLSRSDDELGEEVFLFYSMDELDVRIYHRLLSLVTADRGEGWTIREVENYLRKQTSLPFDHEGPRLESLKQARQRFRDWENRLQMVCQPNWTVDEMEIHARQSAESTQIGGILIDHVQCLSASPALEQDQKFGAAQLGQRLKRLAVELSCPIVASARTGPGPGSPEPHLPERPFEDDALQKALRTCRPHLQHLEEEMGQTADLVLGLFSYEAEYRSLLAKSEIVSDVTTLEVGLLKNRYGAVGSWIQLDLQGRFGLISDPVPD